jgi:hypothetical protein
MTRRTILLLLLGVFVVTPCLLSPFARAAMPDEEDEYLDVEDDTVEDFKGKIVTLTKDNFDSVLKENEHVLVCTFETHSFIFDVATRFTITPCTLTSSDVP